MGKHSMELIAIPQIQPDLVGIIAKVISEHHYVDGYSGYICCAVCNYPYRYGFDTYKEFYNHQAEMILKALGHK
jgi:hypothetical protein